MTGKLKNAHFKFGLFLVMLTLLLTLFPIKKDNILVKNKTFNTEAKVLYEESDSNIIEGESLLKILETPTLKSGYYNFSVNGVIYPVHLIVYDEDQIWTENMTFGDANDVGNASENAKNMIIVKVNGNVLIPTDIKVTTYSNEYGGPKGFFLYVTEDLINNGEISMTAKGGKAAGEDIYLWKNNDETYETVPSIGGIGSAATGTAGIAGGAGTGRQTGGGGSGARSSTSYKSGNGSAGTSYSGGTGGGGSRVASGASAGIANGGQGGTGVGSSSSNIASGGSGNPGGAAGAYGVKGANGTGGLLNIYAHNYQNNGKITANGVATSSAKIGGGSSGGGSINIFIDNDTNIDQTGIITNTRYNEIKGNVTANGGAAVGTSYKGGAGGSGTINIGQIRNGKYYDLKTAINEDKENYINSRTINGESIMSILEEPTLEGGYYNFKVNEENYPVHLYVFDSDQNWSEDKVFGDAIDGATSTTPAQNMVIVKVKGNVTIEEGIKVTAFNNAYGGVKGFFLYVTSKLENKGTITMTGKGAKAEGQNVYLWKNTDDTYESISPVGGAGGTTTTTTGVAGKNGEGRATGGGGSGARNSTSYNVGAGTAGTSYSGGTGGGSSRGVSGASNGTSNGGAGGNSSSASTTYKVSGGTGNPGGTSASNGVAGTNGTGGLLNIYAHNYQNKGTISSDGVAAASAAVAGGSSGGGSINIFIDNSTGIDQTGIITDTRYNEIKGTTSVKGGAAIGTATKAGAGGSGTVNIGQIRNGKYYDLKTAINEDKENYINSRTINGESIMSILEEPTLEGGYYNFKVNEENYPVHLYVFDSDQIWSEDKVFGDAIDGATSTTPAQNMVIVKVKGNVTIEEGIKVTAFNNAYGGVKGFFLYVTGKLENKGTITMTGKGAKAEGQNVYLWKNTDDTYESISSVGGAGAGSVSGAAGTNGGAGTGRSTGGGASGASNGSSYPSGAGTSGTSYSGGTGGGSTRSKTATAGTAFGGAGGKGDSSSSSQYASGGAGNPGGGTAGTYTYTSPNGTGGLLNIYAHNYQNKGTISANGVSAHSSAYYGGGASGGGSINIFIDNNTGIDQLGIITDERYAEIKGTTSVSGGAKTGTYRAGGAGGTGTVNIGKIINGKYYDLKVAIDQDKDKFENGNTIEGESILSILQRDNLQTGYYNFSVNNKEYPVHLYVFDGDQNWATDQIFGNEDDIGSLNTDAQNMVIVKVNGNVNVSENTKITTYKDEYGGPKGFFLYVSGTLTNKGDISMTGCGAKVEGQDVFLWKNPDGTYETVPKVGGAGAAASNVAGKKAVDGANRSTAGGGSGASRSTSYTSGPGGSGTSYSGGTGGGATSISGTNGGAGSNVGGIGGKSFAKDSSYPVSGGTGNPGGPFVTSGAKGADGTGGLLNVYAHKYINEGTLSAEGIQASSSKFGGGSSGGGSINIFIDNDTEINQTGIITDTRYNEIKGTTSAKGGKAIGTTKAGGAGGNGSVSIGTIRDGKYYDLKEAIELDKEEFATSASVKGDSILSIVKEKNLVSGYYNFVVEEENYPVHLIVLEGDQNWGTNQVFGDEKDVATASTDAQNMVIVKVKGSAKIAQGVKIKAFNNEYGGPKGFLLFVTGTLTNNGEIVGAKTGGKGQGQNVYLWKNPDGSYEYIPAIGASGASGITGTNAGKTGDAGVGRSAAGGGSGANRGSTGKSGNGGTGTSYSGGTGGGANGNNTSVAGAGSNVGANGGNAITSTNSSYAAGGGAGNKGGSGIVSGTNGTAGLITVYADKYVNNGIISSNGESGGNTNYGGGSSGGGSINLFINNEIIIDQLGVVTNTKYEEIKGEVEAKGGASVGKTKVGGAGGAGTVNIGKIIDGKYYDLKDAIDLYKEEFKSNSSKKGDSILEIVGTLTKSGYYNLEFNNENYPIHLYVLDGNQSWISNKTFGDIMDIATSSNDAQNMVVVKVNGNLTIENDVVVTAISNEYGGPKGFLLYVCGKLINNGSISMSGKGAKAVGQNVYLYKNQDETYETVPALGGAGGLQTSGTKVGNSGIAGIDRATGGGGSGSSKGSSSTSGAGGSGTSYSGGIGGGASTNGTKALNGSSTGGIGGNAGVNTSYPAGGGTGNPGGKGSAEGTQGSGGLLTIFSNIYENNGIVSATGIPASTVAYGGGSSGGGSINVFYTLEYKAGTINVSGGAPIGSTKKGGKGGNGTYTAKEIVIDDELRNPTLATLEVDKGVLSPEFNKRTNEYDVTLAKEDYKVNITATLSNQTNTITSGVGEFDIPAYDSTHNVVVTSAAGLVNIYKINFHREPNNYEYLKGITINKEEIEGFSPTKFEYDINLTYKYDDIEIGAIYGSTSQQIYGTGNIHINSGSSVLYIDVTSEDKTKTSQYKLNFYREHSSKIKSLSFNEYTLEPEFNPETYTYTINILSSDMSLPVDYKLYDEEAKAELSGFGYVKTTQNASIKVTEPNSEPTTYNIKIVKGNLDSLIYDYSCTENVQEFTAPLTGNYKIEAWGARGGYGRTNNSWTHHGGYGAYTKGTIRLNKGQKLYVYVGCIGKDGGKLTKYIGGAGGYNGGAKGGNDSNSSESAPDPAGGGGGATDIRLTSGSPDDFNSLKSRIIVAAGGGGATYSYNGYAGGLNINNSSNTYNFGIGRPGFTAAYGSGGGAGGYFGGSSNQKSNGIGYGGTSYVSGYSSSYAISESSTSSNITLSNSSKHYSGFIFKDIEIFNGNESMPSSVSGYVTGNNGEGHAKITLLNEPPANNFLSNLTVKSGGKIKEYTPSFEIDKFEYNLKLESDDVLATILAKPEDSLAMIDGLGEHEIKPGKTDIVVTVIAQDNTKREYIIHAEREASSNPYPNNITLSGLVPSLCKSDSNTDLCKMTPEFDKDTNTYNLTVPAKIKQLYINVDKGHFYQTVLGDGKIDLEGGDNTFNVIVTSEDESNSKTYTFNITRDMTGNADLLKLEVEDPKRDISFDPGVTEYYISVPNEYTNIKTLDVETDDPLATYIVSNNEDFVVGTNEVQITVTAQNGDVKVYTIFAYREKSGNIYLSNLSVKQGETLYSISPEFNKVKTGDYTLAVENSVENIEILATAEHSLTTIVGAGEKTLKAGVNKFIITTTAEDGSTENYVLLITRKRNSNVYLNSIEVKNGDKQYTLTPEFNKDITSYKVQVDEGVTSIDITATPEVSTTKYKLLDNSKLVVGKNTKRILTTAEDGSTLIYEIEITRPASSNTYLKNIKLSNGVLSPEFNKEIVEYTVNLDNNVKSIEITGEKEAENSSVSGNGKYSLNVGSNEITLTVTAEDGSTKDYEIKIERAKNSNANLSMITTDVGILVPEFDKTQNKFSVNVENDVEYITILATPEESTTKVTGDGKFKLTSGNNIFEIVTLAEDGITTLTYTIDVYKDKSNNDNLTFLALKEASLSPKFDPNIISYTAYVPFEMTEVNVIAKLEDEKASYIVRDNTNLELGENDVVVEVTSESGKTKEYVIKVMRQDMEESSNYLSSLEINNGTLTPEFDKTTLFYEVTVPNEVKNITVTGKAEDTNAVVTGTGTFDLSVGDNLISVRVTSLDNKIRDYQILIERKESQEARLSNLSLNDLTLSPEFDKDVYEYTVTSPDTYLDFNKITTLDEKASYEIMNNSFLTIGNYEVTIRVTAADKETTKDYVIKVQKIANSNNNLSSLSVEGYTLTPEFNKSVTVYTLTVPNDVNSVVVNATAENSASTITGIGSQNLELGENEIVVRVTSEAGLTKAYTIMITKKGSSNNKISDLQVLNGELSPEFKNDTNTYDVTVNYEEESLNLLVTLEDDNASYEITNNTLKVGENTVYVIVKAEDGSENKITLNVTRKEIVSALLENIEVKNYNLNPEFNSNIMNYNLLIDNEVMALDLLVTPKDKKATYTITGNENFEIGENTVTITVNSSDGKKTENYTLTVNRQSYSNTYLDYLYTSEGDVHPEFNKENLSYTIEVENTVDKIEIFAEAIDKTATVTGAKEYSLKTGENKINVVVTTTSNISRTYIVTVTRKKSSENSLKSLKVLVNGVEKELTPEFDKDTKEYNLEVLVGTKEVVIDAVSNGGIISGNGKQIIKAGSNELKVIVTAEDGSVNTYTININRPKSSNNNLTTLVPSEGDLSPSFIYTNNSYELWLDSAVSSLSFAYTTEEETSIVSGYEKQLVPDGESIRQIVVKAEDGSVNTYTVKVIKERTDNAYLKSLSVTNYNITPEFDKNTFRYYLTVPNSKTSLIPSEVIAIPEDVNSKVQKSTNMALSTSSDSTFKIIVTAPDGYTKQTYEIVVTREKSNVSRLSKLTVKTGKLNTKFDPDTYEYTWTVPKDTLKIDSTLVSYILEDLSSKVNVSPDIDMLDGGDHIYKITVTSEDESSTTEYKLKVEYEKSSDANLLNLKIDKGILSSAFNSKLYEYDVYEYIDTKSINITTSLSNEYASVIGDGELLLEEDEFDHSVVVTAEDGTIKEYILHIHKDISNEKYLKNIKLENLDKVSCADDECKLSPEFDSDTLEYVITVPYEYADLSILAETVSEDQSVKFIIDNKEMPDGYKLPVGSTIVTIEVYDGMNEKTMEYTLNIVRDKSSNNYLLDLEVEGYELSPEFDKTIEKYTISVKNTVDEVKVNAEAEDENATLSINGYNFLQEGDNELTVEVTSANGKVRKYIINVVKELPDNSYLSNITVSNGVFFELSPKFNKETTKYSTTVNHYDTKVTVEATPELSTTTISGIKEYDLENGLNTIKLTATSKSGEIKVYTINITKPNSKNVNLKELTIKEGILNPVFNPAIVKYEVNVNENVDSLTISAVPEDPTSTVQIIGNKDFITGENKVNIIVYSNGKVSSKTYQIIVNKQANTNNNLLTLKVNDKLVEGFNKEKLQYNLEVENNVDNVKISGEAENKSSIIKGLGTYSLSEGDNEIVVEVISEAGVNKKYRLNIKRKYNTYLSNIYTDRGNITPEFNKETLNYTMEVESNINDITVLGIKEDENAVLTGNDKYTLNPGENNITLTVTNNTEERIYNIKVTKKLSDNAFLKYLTVGEGILSPEFDKETENYTVNIPFDKTSLSLDYQVEEESSNVEIIDNNLIQKENTVIIRVTSESGKTKDYTLNVIKEDENVYSNKLASLSVDQGTLTPEFDKDTNLYNVTVSEKETEITIEATAEDSEVTIKGDGVHNLSSGRNVITVTVTSKDNFDRVYTIIVNRNNVAEARLSYLEFEDGKFTSSFNKNTYNYILQIEEPLNMLTIKKIVPVNKDATINIEGLILTGENDKVIIEVTAPDKVTKKNYEITVNKIKSSNAYLKDLSSNIGKLTPEFDKQKNLYKLLVEKDVNSINIIATKESKLSIVEGAGTYNLTEENNIINITVTAENGNTNIYTILVEKQKDNNAYLKSLIVRGFTLDFDKEKLDYELEVENSIDSVNIEGVADALTTTVSGNGEKSLKSGENTFSIITTAEDGTTLTYSIKINRKKLQSSKLTKLSVEEGVIDPKFDPSTLVYNVSIPNDFEEITINYITEEEGAVVEITGNEDLEIDIPKEIQVKVTSSSGEETIYKIIATREKMSNNYLSSLSVEEGEITPEFDKLVLEYHLEVENDVSSINVSATPEIETSAIVGDGPHDINTGENEIIITVTSEENIERKYKLIVIRKKNSNVYLKSLSHSVGELTPEFKKETTKYELNVDDTVDKINIEGEAESETSIVTGNGEYLINSLETNISVIVTGEDGTTKLYEILVKRTLSNNKNILSIIPSDGELTPEFDNEGDDTYTLKVDSSVNIVSFDVELESSLSTVTGNKNIELETNEKDIIILITAEDGTTREINIKIQKESKVEDIILEDNVITVIKGEKSQINATVKPDTATNKDVSYKSLDEEIALVSITGEITGKNKGNTKIEISSVDNPEIKRELVVNVIEGKITSNVYNVQDKEENNRIVIGAEPKTSLEDFIGNLENEEEYIKIYTKDGVEITDKKEIAKTGQIIKLEINGKVYDEAVIIIRGDIDGDGLVKISDKGMIGNHVLKIKKITGYEFYAGDLDDDGQILVADKGQLGRYILHQITTLN